MEGVILLLYQSCFSFPFSYPSFRDDFQSQREVKSSDMRFATEQPSVATVSKPNSLLTSLWP
ncbi:MAG: hypothetical protein OXB86_02605 [Bdellovibrionales bacterium]|nr:hypothetical protein [Bdellovibrionales bacterium]